MVLRPTSRMNGEASAAAAGGGGKKGSSVGGKKVNGLAHSAKKALSPPPAVPQSPPPPPTQRSPAAADGDVSVEAAAAGVEGKALCARKPPLPASASRQERAANSTIKDTTDGGDRVLFTLQSIRVRDGEDRRSRIGVLKDPTL